MSKPSGYTQNSVIINSLENKVKKVDFENLLSEECKNFIWPLQRLGYVFFILYFLSTFFIYFSSANLH